jgi:hypothetical protein
VRELCAQIVSEQDQARMLKLITELNDIPQQPARSCGQIPTRLLPIEFVLPLRAMVKLSCHSLSLGYREGFLAAFTRRADLFKLNCQYLQLFVGEFFDVDHLVVGATVRSNYLVQFQVDCLSITVLGVLD